MQRKEKENSPGVTDVGNEIRTAKDNPNTSVCDWTLVHVCLYSFVFSE